MASKLAEDLRIDPRLKEVFGGLNVTATGDVASREDLLAEETTEAGKARAAAFAARQISATERVVVAIRTTGYASTK